MAFFFLADAARGIDEQLKESVGVSAFGGFLVKAQARLHVFRAATSIIGHEAEQIANVAIGVLAFQGLECEGVGFVIILEMPIEIVGGDIGAEVGAEIGRAFVGGKRLVVVFQHAPTVPETAAIIDPGIGMAAARNLVERFRHEITARRRFGALLDRMEKRDGRVIELSVALG